MSLIVACGLKREAAIVRRPGVLAIAGGGQPEWLEVQLRETVTAWAGEGWHFAALLSAGIAGALDPALVPGDIVIDGDADTADRLHAILPAAHRGIVVGQDVPAATVEAKRAMAQDGALAVDMESHVARRVAAERGLPFGVVRAIADTADQALPPAALVGMAPDGGMALGAVLWSLAKQPGQLPALIAVGRDSGIAFRALGAAFDRLAVARFGQD